jgi:hypothetical protein
MANSLHRACGATQESQACPDWFPIWDAIVNSARETMPFVHKRHAISGIALAIP